jgi:hypothetical protein
MKNNKTDNAVSILTLAFSVCLFLTTSLAAHNAPYEWNLKLKTEIDLSNKTIEEAVVLINKAVEKESEGKIKHVLSFHGSNTPAAIKDETRRPDLADHVKRIISARRKVEAKGKENGLKGYATRTTQGKIYSDFPLACQFSSLASSAGFSYQETKKGAALYPRATKLIVKVYPLPDKLKEIKSLKINAGRLHDDDTATATVVGQYSGLYNWMIITREKEYSPFQIGRIQESFIMVIGDKEILLLAPENNHKEVQKDLSEESLNRVIHELKSSADIAKLRKEEV